MDIFQECECPNSFDFDLSGDDMLVAGDSYLCPHCGETHKAEDLKVQVVVRNKEKSAFYGLPKNKAELQRYADSL